MHAFGNRYFKGARLEDDETIIRKFRRTQSNGAFRTSEGIFKVDRYAGMMVLPASVKTSTGT